MFIFAIIILLVALVWGLCLFVTDRKALGLGVGLSGIFLSILLIICSSFYIVNPGEVGVEIFFGKVANFSDAGFHWKSPFTEIVNLNLRTQKFEQKLEGASNDLQEITVDIAINYRLDFERIGDLYSKVGKDYISTIIEPAVLNLAKAGISKYPISEIITKRNELAETIQTTLSERLSRYYMVLENVNLSNINFSPKFTEAVTEKQVQEQNVQTAEYKRQQAEKNKQSTILDAQAEAEKQRLLAANTSRDVVELKWIEAWKDGGAKMPETLITTGDKGLQFLLQKK